MQIAKKITIYCSNCQHLIHLPQKYGGKKVKCPMCDDVLVVHEAEPLVDASVLLEA